MVSHILFMATSCSYCGLMHDEIVKHDCSEHFQLSNVVSDETFVKLGGREVPAILCINTKQLYQGRDAFQYLKREFCTWEAYEDTCGMASIGDEGGCMLSCEEAQCERNMDKIEQVAGMSMDDAMKMRSG